MRRRQRADQSRARLHARSRPHTDARASGSTSRSPAGAGGIVSAAEQCPPVPRRRRASTELRSGCVPVFCPGRRGASMTGDASRAWPAGLGRDRPMRKSPLFASMIVNASAMLVVLPTAFLTAM
jgi:hypothetical protein